MNKETYKAYLRQRLYEIASPNIILRSQDSELESMEPTTAIPKKMVSVKKTNPTLDIFRELTAPVAATPKPVAELAREAEARSRGIGPPIITTPKPNEQSPSQREDPNPSPEKFPVAPTPATPATSDLPATPVAPTPAAPSSRGRGNQSSRASSNNTNSGSGDQDNSTGKTTTGERSTNSGAVGNNNTVTTTGSKGAVHFAPINPAVAAAALAPPPDTTVAFLAAAMSGRPSITTGDNTINPEPKPEPKSNPNPPGMLWPGRPPKYPTINRTEDPPLEPFPEIFGDSSPTTPQTPPAAEKETKPVPEKETKPVPEKETKPVPTQDSSVNDSGNITLNTGVGAGSDFSGGTNNLGVGSGSTNTVGAGGKVNFGTDLSQNYTADSNNTTTNITNTNSPGASSGDSGSGVRSTKSAAQADVTNKAKTASTTG